MSSVFSEESTPLSDDLVRVLERLDQLLARAFAAAQAVYESGTATDPYRGLYLSRSEMERLLARDPASPLLPVNDRAEAFGSEDGADSNLARLTAEYCLAPFDTEVLLLALAPEIDLRYEKLYAYLQDDVTRKRPTVNLALDLLCESVEAKRLRLDNFAPNAPLVQHRLLHLVPDPQQVEPSLLAHYLKLDEQIVRLLLGLSGLDTRLAQFSRLVTPTTSLGELAIADETKRVLEQFVWDARTKQQSLKLFFHGPKGVGKARAAEALAHAADMPLLRADLAYAPPGEVEIYPTLFREGFLRNAILLIEGLDALSAGDAKLELTRFLDAWTNARGITIVAGNSGWTAGIGMPRDVVTVPFARPDFSQRRAAWETNLRAQGIELAAEDLEAITGRFRLTPEQIAEAAALARQQLHWQATAHFPNNGTASPANVRATLFGAARREMGNTLAALARKIEPVHTWEDLVLPQDAVTQLEEICQRVAQQHRVMQEWGFERKLALGKGVNALFAGPSGTGKTTAAEIIANELGLELYKIDLANVVSKYIGETEKNLERIFSAAENANVILFFDEADALFGKRSEVRDSHDRYANIEIAYLLQKIEQYDGVAILATNLRQNMDDAFVRRLQFIIEFPFPDEIQRAQIWRLHFPPEAPRDRTLDFDYLAHHFRLSGGNIKNIVLGAAFLAASDGGAIAMPHLMQATRREYQKMGKVMPAVQD